MIIIATITESAAVSIHGEFMHSSCNFNSKSGKDNFWENTIIVVVDEISFIKRPNFGKLDKALNEKCNAPSIIFFVIYRWYLLVTSTNQSHLIVFPIFFIPTRTVLGDIKESTFLELKTKY